MSRTITLHGLSFDELQLFGMQLTDYHEFEAIVSGIRAFRENKKKNVGRYKLFLKEERDKVIQQLFKWEIDHGDINTRESREVNLKHFIETKGNNLRDYADACLRYFRATGLVTITNPGRSISIIENRKEEVEFLLANIPRDPIYVSDEARYKAYLFDSTIPALFTDNRKNLNALASKCVPSISSDELNNETTANLKKKIKQVLEKEKQKVIEKQVEQLKSYSAYNDVIMVFDEIKNKTAYDAPLTLEWNTWRAMTMIDGGDIKANLSFDSAGNPMATAPGKNADIVCDYGSFYITVEVTMQSGHRQYETEGEPVARHLGTLKTNTGKPAYCFFIAPTINDSVVAHFYVLQKSNISFYGGTSTIIPLTLDRFVMMLRQTKQNGYIPSPNRVRSFCEYAIKAADNAANEKEWYQAINDRADHWLEYDIVPFQNEEEAPLLAAGVSTSNSADQFTMPWETPLGVN